MRWVEITESLLGANRAGVSRGTLIEEAAMPAIRGDPREAPGKIAPIAAEDRG